MEGSREAVVLDQIVGYLKNTALDPTVAIPLDRSLLEAGILDSYGIVDLVTYLESEFNLAIPDDDVSKEKMGSLRKMASYVARRKAA